MYVACVHIHLYCESMYVYVQMYIHMKAKDALKCSEECGIPPVTYGLPEP